jgi:hypothetical protein
MNKQRMFILVAAVIGAIATFLPWIELAMGSVAGTKGDGWLTLPLFTISAVLAVLGNRMAPLSGASLYGTMVPALLAGLLGIYKIVDINSSLPSGDNPFALAMRQTMSVGIGLYLVALAGVAVPAIAYFLRDSE